MDTNRAHTHTSPTRLLPTGDIIWTSTEHTLHVTDRITANRWHHMDTNRTHTTHVTNRITADSWHHPDTNQTHTPRHWQDYCWQVTSHRHQQDTHTTHHWQDYCQQVTSFINETTSGKGKTLRFSFSFLLGKQMLILASSNILPFWFLFLTG